MKVDETFRKGVWQMIEGTLSGNEISGSLLGVRVVLSSHDAWTAAMNLFILEDDAALCGQVVKEGEGDLFLVEPETIKVQLWEEGMPFKSIAARPAKRHVDFAALESESEIANARNRAIQAREAREAALINGSKLLQSIEENENFRTTFLDSPFQVIEKNEDEAFVILQYKATLSIVRNELKLGLSNHAVKMLWRQHKHNPLTVHDNFQVNLLGTHPHEWTLFEKWAFSLAGKVIGDHCVELIPIAVRDGVLPLLILNHFQIRNGILYVNANHISHDNLSILRQILNLTVPFLPKNAKLVPHITVFDNAMPWSKRGLEQDGITSCAFILLGPLNSNTIRAEFLMPFDETEQESWPCEYELETATAAKLIRAKKLVPAGSTPLRQNEIVLIPSTWLYRFVTDFPIRILCLDVSHSGDDSQDSLHEISSDPQSLNRRIGLLQERDKNEFGRLMDLEFDDN